MHILKSAGAPHLPIDAHVVLLKEIEIRESMLHVELGNEAVPHSCWSSRG